MKNCFIPICPKDPKFLCKCTKPPTLSCKTHFKEHVMQPTEQDWHSVISVNNLASNARIILKDLTNLKLQAQEHSIKLINTVQKSLQQCLSSIRKSETLMKNLQRKILSFDSEAIEALEHYKGFDLKKVLRLSQSYSLIENIKILMSTCRWMMKIVKMPCCFIEMELRCQQLT